MIIRLGSVLMVMVVAVAACTTPPLGDPSIEGVVTNLAGGLVLVEENPQQSAGSAKAAVRMTGETQVIFASGATASSTDLSVGDRVRVWFTGPVMESYPVQATASRIEILSR